MKQEVWELEIDMTYNMSQALRADHEEELDALVSKVLKRKYGWFKNFHRTSDFGIDVQANLMIPDDKVGTLKMTNKGVSFQLKAGSSYKRVTECDNVSVIYAKFTNNIDKLKNWIDIWFKNPFQVYIIWLPEPEEEPDKAYWISLETYIKQNPEFPSSKNMIFKFPLENEFNQAQMSDIRNYITEDKSGERIRELPRNSFLNIDGLISDLEKDRFKSSKLGYLIEFTNNILEKPSEKEKRKLWGAMPKLIKNFYIGGKTNFPKTLSAPIYLSDADYKDIVIAEEYFIINAILKECQNQEKTSEKGIKDFINSLQREKDTKFTRMITTPLGKKFLANNRLIKMETRFLFLKDTNLKIVSLLGKLDQLFGTFFIFSNEEKIGKRSSRGAKAIIRTFDPNDRIPILRGIDPEKNFEFEFHHPIDYLFFLPKINSMKVLMFKER
ncbi:MAG: DUF4365 domain-containing protein [Candidatus Hodarchaeota archaeon]